MEDGWKKPLFLLNWMEKYNNKVMTKLDAIENMFGTAGEADVAPTDIKSGKKAYNGTTLVTGTMPSNTAEQKLLSCGQSYSIQEGYHDGTGMVSADTLANQTAGTAAAGDVLISKTAYVNGSKVTGTMPEQGAKSKELACGEAYTIPAGHHNGQGKVTAKSLVSQTGATAVATKLLAGLTAWVNGNKITGTMANKAGTTVKAAAVTQDDNNTYFAIPAAGYYDTASKVYTENSNLGKTSFARFATTNQVYNENSPSGIIPFNNNNFDETDFTLSPDSTAITVEQSGTYTLDIHINGGNRTTTCLMVNGNIKLGDNSYSSNAGPFTQSYSGILNLNKGDKISIYYRGTSWGGSNQGFVAGSWFSIGKLKK